MRRRTRPGREEAAPIGLQGQVDSIEAPLLSSLRGYIERLAVGREADVRGVTRGHEEAELLALRAEDPEAAVLVLLAPRGRVDVPVAPERHAVYRATVRAEVVEHALARKRSVGGDREGDELMVPLRVAVRIGDVGDRAVGGDDDAVGLLDILRRERHLSVRRDSKDALEVDLTGIAFAVSGVGEVDVPLRIDREIVGAVESPAFPFLREGSHLSVRIRDRDPPIAAGIRPFADNEAALRVELHPVRAAARVAVDARLHRLRIEAQDAVADVAEIDRHIR